MLWAAAYWRMISAWSPGRVLLVFGGRADAVSRAGTSVCTGDDLHDFTNSKWGGCITQGSQSHLKSFCYLIVGNRGRFSDKGGEINSENFTFYPDQRKPIL